MVKQREFDAASLRVFWAALGPKGEFLLMERLSSDLFSSSPISN
jgi:hypothetical protein